jgi:hypothetical protein
MSSPWGEETGEGGRHTHFQVFLDGDWVESQLCHMTMPRHIFCRFPLAMELTPLQGLEI